MKMVQLWATGDRQLHHDNVPTQASFLMQKLLSKHQITQVTQPPTAQILCPVTLAFPPTKLTYERKDHPWDSGKCNRVADGDSNKKFFTVFWTVEEMLGELCELRTLKGSHCLMYNVSCTFFHKCLFFITKQDTLWIILSATKKETLTFVTIWMKLEVIMQIKYIFQKEKYKHCMILFICRI